MSDALATDIPNEDDFSTGVVNKKMHRDSVHVMEGDHQRLSRFYDVKVERSYQELDDILEEEKRKEFAQTEAGKARSRLYGPSSRGSGHYTAVERANHLLHRKPIGSAEEDNKSAVVNKRAVFSPRSPKAKLRILSATHVPSSPPKRNGLKKHPSPSPSHNNDPSTTSVTNKASTTAGNNNENEKVEPLYVKNKTKIKPAPLALRPELITLGLQLTDEMKEHAADPSETPEQDDEEENDDVNDDDVNDDVNDECLLVLLVLSSPDQMLHIHARSTMAVCIYTSNVVFICLYVMVELTLPINYRSIHAVFQCSNLPGTWNRPRFSTNPGAKARLCTPTFATPTPTGTPPATTTTVSLAVPKPCWSCCCPWW